MLINWPQERLDELYKRMQEDFPANERPPRHVLNDKIRSGQLKAYALRTEEDHESAYALCTGEDAVLITHLAVRAGSRGLGTGTKWLDTLAAMHANEHTHLIVEVELPRYAQNEQDQLLRQRRIAFYKRAGYVPYPNVDYFLFGVPMLLMVKPLKDVPLPSSSEVGPWVHKAYSCLVPEALMSRITYTIK